MQETKKANKNEKQKEMLCVFGAHLIGKIHLKRTISVISHINNCRRMEIAAAAAAFSQRSVPKMKL